MENTTNAAPTGCYKCGRPGHWSRDCPSSSSSAPSNPNFSSNNTTGAAAVSKTLLKDKPKKVPRSRPKLTSDLLLSDDGLGFVLRHFPRAFKYRGRGHEVKDLGNLIGLYSEWHSHLLPYYSFDQFIHKVEQVAASKHVKACIRDLRERVASGGDPTKLHEAPVEQDGPTGEHVGNAEMMIRPKCKPSSLWLKQLYYPAKAKTYLNSHSPTEAMASEGYHHPGDQSLNIHAADGIHEDLLQEIYKKATEVNKNFEGGEVEESDPAGIHVLEDSFCPAVSSSCSCLAFSRCFESMYLIPSTGHVGSCASRVYSIRQALIRKDVVVSDQSCFMSLEENAHKLKVPASLHEPSRALQSDMVAADVSRKISASNAGSSSNEVQITEEQRARMEANRLKAMERAAARARPLQAS
ncbi:hypothetical protein JRO89_XS05G0173400 [Xanthoceras sorbifolium]|uniref:CCHC-type domain-containing protein n=1 Tax=Xanthoceras sorbifolium TaxID=99658 RepID=A0ABQ8I299_9ROSI|nr:hypothetical protein JRO89_XS05G0173400 [Xanthoceras sorbifolium]